MGTHAIMSLIPFFVVAVHAGAAIVSDDVCSPSSSWQTDMILGANFINTSSVESAEDCCSSCEANQGCYAWTFEHPSSSGGDNCFLKDDVFFREEKLGAVSGQSRPSPYGDGSIGRACSTTETSGFPFCNLSLSTQARVNDLIGRLSLAEKAAMLTARQSPGGDVPRLGVPEYDWGTNCIHGVQSRCTQPLTKGDATTIRCPTSFPNPIGLGGSFNRSLWRQMASVIGLELRALWLQGVGENHLDNLPHVGLDCWSPNINIARDPRWGRVLETTGEDPMLTGTFGVEYTRGLQEKAPSSSSSTTTTTTSSSSNDDGSDNGDGGYLQAVVTLKHFAAYSVEDYEGVSRHNYDAEVSAYDAATTFFPAWRRSIKGGAARGVMCSYNEVNGVPSCASDFLLRNVLRGEEKAGGFGFDGYVTSDSGAVADIYLNDSHAYAASPPEGVALALNATCDVDSNLGTGDEDTGSPYTWYVQDAVDEGLLEYDENGGGISNPVDAAMNRTLFLRFALGLFDYYGPDDDQDAAKNPLWHVDPGVIASDAHVELAREATQQSLVLLRNDPTTTTAIRTARWTAKSAKGTINTTTATTLPFAKGQKVAVIGPHANATEALLGNYLGQICAEGYKDWSCVTTPFEALSTANAGGETSIALGCENVECKSDALFGLALAAASEADAVVLMLGIDTSNVEREGLDRTSIALPGLQEELALQVLALGKPTAAVFLHGGALGIDALANYDSSSSSSSSSSSISGGPLAILSAFYPGPFGSAAVAGAIFGDFSPSGRLPYTMFGSAYVDEKDFLVMDMAEGAGSTYKYYTGDNVLWTFGYGLDYASFELSNDDDDGGGAGVSFGVEDAAAEVRFDALTVARTDTSPPFDGPAQLVLQAFVRPLDVPGLANGSSSSSGGGGGDGVQMPFKQLVDFARSPGLLSPDDGSPAPAPSPSSVVLDPLVLPADAFALADFATGDLSVWPGSYEVQLWDGRAPKPNFVTPVTVTGDAPRLVTPFPKAAAAQGE